MSTFSKDPATFDTHAAYVGLLKTALKKVNPQPPIKFLYYKDYKFGTKKLPLVLVDYDLSCPAVLAGKGLKPMAEGLLSLTTKDELDFDVKKGKLNRKQLKRYFESMPGTMKAVFVTDADADESSEEESAADGEGKPLPGIPGKSPLPVQAQAKAKPLPIPPELLQRLKDLSQTTLLPEWEKKKHETLETALALMKGGDLRKATLVLDGLAAKALTASSSSAKPLPTTPTAANVAAVQMVKAEILADLEDSEQEGDESGEGGGEDDSSEEVVLDSPAAKKAALSPATSVASAQQRLAEEDAAFRHRKTAKKSDKIKVSASQQEKEKKEQEAKDAKKAAKAKAKEEASGKGGLLGFLSFERKKGDKPSKEEQDRIDRALANKKADDEIKKYVGTPLKVGSLAGTAERGLASGVGKALDAGNTGDDIASAAGSIATSTAGVATSLMDAFRAFSLYSKTSGAERSVHLKKAMEALGGAFGNLVNLTKGSLNVAEHAGALEAGSAVPILGIVAAIPTLLAEINDLRSAMTRLIKQEKVIGALDKQIKAGDTSQATLHTMLSAFMARDAESVGKGIARVTLDFTKIAGHGVSAGGITGPIGVALVAVGSAGKLVISGVGTVEEYVDANKANDRRKKLQPTLNAARDWKDLRKERPDAKENADLTLALQVLAKAQRGTKEHAEALDKVGTCAQAVKKVNAGSPKVLEYATALATQATQEKESWKGGEDEDEDDEEQGQGSGGQDPHQRNAKKLIKRDPQVAAQVLLDQAQREGPPGGPAFKVLKSFGIKASQVYGAEQGDDRIASNREMRQKILFKLGADDETAQTLTQTLGGAKEGVKDYFSMRTKHKELADYMEAKNLLQHGGEQKRGKGWRLKMDILTDDIEEKKEALLAQVEHLAASKDIDAALAQQVRVLLKPRKEKA